jgi:hypothetical protein
MPRNRRRGLQSRMTAGGGEHLQLSSTLTFAEEAVRASLEDGLGYGRIRFVRRELIIPRKRHKEEPVSRDDLAHFLKAKLADAVAERHEWLSLNERSRQHIYFQTDAAYMSSRPESERGIDMRHVFFKCTAIVRKPEGRGSVWLDVRAIVQVWSISGALVEARVKVWTRSTESGQERDWHGGSFVCLDLTTVYRSNKIPDSPPDFLCDRRRSRTPRNRVAIAA